MWAIRSYIESCTNGVEQTRMRASGCCSLAVALTADCGVTVRAWRVRSTKSCEAGTLRVIAYLDNKPFSWEADDGKPKGIDVDLRARLPKELGVKADVVLRMQGEKADDDLRGNVWRGPLTGGGVGDVMMHVPIDREFASRNTEAVYRQSLFRGTRRCRRRHQQGCQDRYLRSVQDREDRGPARHGRGLFSDDLRRWRADREREPLREAAGRRRVFLSKQTPGARWAFAPTSRALLHEAGVKATILGARDARRSYDRTGWSAWP